MLQARQDIQPGNWEITATTIRCDHVDDFVTIMVESDWSARCVWYGRYKEASPQSSKAKPDKAVRSRIPLCLGPECPLVIEYRDKLIDQETPVK